MEKIRKLMALPLLPFAAMGAAYYGYLGFFNPFLTLWLKEAGYSLIAISALAALQPLSRLFTPYLWGMASDSTGERILLIRLAAVFAFMTSIALWFDLELTSLAVVLFLIYATTTAITPMNEAAMAHWIASSGTFDAQRFGQTRLFGSIAFLVTVYIAGFLFERSGIGMFPQVVTAMILLIVLVSLLMPQQRHARDVEVHEVSVRDLLRKPEVRLFFASVFFHLLSLTGTYVYLSLYLDSLGYGKSFIGIVWAASVVIEILWFYYQGRILPRASYAAWLWICGAVAFVRLGVTAAFAQHWPILLLAQASHAITFAADHTVCSAFLTKFFPGRLRGRGQAIYTIIGFGMTGLIGTFAGGALTSVFSIASIFWAGMVASTISMAIAAKLYFDTRLQSRLALRT